MQQKKKMKQRLILKAAVVELEILPTGMEVEAVMVEIEALATGTEVETEILVTWTMVEGAMVEMETLTMAEEKLNISNTY